MTTVKITIDYDCNNIEFFCDAETDMSEMLADISECAKVVSVKRENANNGWIDVWVDGEHSFFDLDND